MQVWSLALHADYRGSWRPQPTAGLACLLVLHLVGCELGLVHLVRRGLLLELFEGSCASLGIAEGHNFVEFDVQEVHGSSPDA